jgi:cation transport ATPase
LRSAKKSAQKRKMWLEQLQSRGLELGVLTGDEASAGARWQKALGIPVSAALSPDEKMKRLIENSAMVGDGINDGPRSPPQRLDLP